MNRLAIMLLAGAIGFSATPASAAISLVANQCASVFGSQGCQYSGVVSNQAEANALELLYNNANNSFTPNTDIDLNYLAKIDAGNFGGSLSNIVTKPGEPGEIISATYTNLNWTIRYFGIKAGPSTVLFAVPSPGSSFSWNTARLGNKGMSHIVFFGDVGAIPEPATWAMMLGGFGMLGVAIRRRQRPIFSLT